MGTCMWRLYSLIVRSTRPFFLLWVDAHLLLDALAKRVSLHPEFRRWAMLCGLESAYQREG
ncbi:hypothetical protein FA13DRAFT_1728844 [Coprinellus micaceus]|uniref:Uncharacterized protein n=1 Tax=Coprinellus micaceus TaxID=71717 RepID=A0A4Y7TM62_COPMI|nr:hypothetical protein FA13DRAFT_1728844 [Coprinellus micaceus]